MPIVIRSLIFVSIVIGLTASGCGRASARSHRIGILNWTEKFQAFQETYRGLLDGLMDAGFREGVDIEILYRNAGESRDLALAMARELAAEGVDLIAAMGTGSTFAARAVAGPKGMPVVFTIVAAPKATGLIQDYDAIGGTVTGVSMEIPVAVQLRRVREAIPHLKSLGILYSTEMPQAVATGEEAVAVARELGWTPEVAAFPLSELPRLASLAESLAKTVDAIYVPPDPILCELDHLRVVIRACGQRKVPVIAVSGEEVAAGALMAIHCDFRGIGRRTAYMVDQVLRGADVRSIPPERPGIQRLSLNLKKAKELGLEIPRNLILKADVIVDY